MKHKFEGQQGRRSQVGPLERSDCMIKKVTVTIILGFLILGSLATYWWYGPNRYYREAEPVANLLHSMPVDLAPATLSEESILKLIEGPKYQLLNQYPLSFHSEPEFVLEVDVNKRYLLRKTKDGPVEWTVKND